MALSSRGPPLPQVLNGTVCKEARQSFSPWLNATTRLCMGSPRVEVEWTVGAVPIADGLGKEVIARYTTNIATAGVWYTDSNGREMIRRQRNHRPTWKLNVTEPVAGAPRSPLPRRAHRLILTTLPVPRQATTTLSTPPRS